MGSKSDLLTFLLLLAFVGAVTKMQAIIQDSKYDSLRKILLQCNVEVTISNSILLRELG